MAEILAPAGSFDSVIAAVRCGANAVYLGGKSFNARRNASNFSDEELKKAVDYCHARGVKVYQTLNTLVSDDEFEEAYDAVKCACECNVDALILQDTGLAALVRRVSSSMPMHASTQMSVQSIEGIRMLEKMGFSRAVLPRELSEKEIKEISSRTEIELEYFVHGALCMCVSGQCLMSSVLGGRSGNRGLCAQPCRLPFGVNESGGNALSLKDLSLVDELSRLEDAGVCSFKIEGRMKRPEYVAAAVTACRNSLNGTPDNSINEALKAVFSRSGFTKGYFEGRLGKDMFGIRRKEDVEGASGVLSSLEKLYEKEKPLIPVSLSMKFRRGEKMLLEVSSGGLSVRIQSGFAPEKALNRAILKEELEERLSKCGGTQFYIHNIYVDFEEGLNASVSAINALRREAFEALEQLLTERKEKTVKSYEFNPGKHIAAVPQIHARFFGEEQIPEKLDGISRAVVPLETSCETINKLKSAGIEVAAEIPQAVFSNYEKYISQLSAKNFDLAWICTLDGAGIAEKAGKPFACGFGMNIFNSSALEEMKSLGAEDALLSCECTLKQVSGLGGEIHRGLMIYGRIPLMVTRNCPVKNKISCTECKSKSHLLDRMNVEFPVVCKNGCSYILNSRPLWMADKAVSGIDFGLMYFTIESKEEIAEVIKAYSLHSPADGEFTRGLYIKGVL